MKMLVCSFCVFINKRMWREEVEVDDDQRGSAVESVVIDPSDRVDL